MNCRLCRDLLQDVLDGTPLPDPAAVDRHLAACAGCRGLFTAAGWLDDGIRCARVPAVPPLLTERIVTRILAEQRARRRWRPVLRATAAVAAALLLFVSAVERTPPQAPPTQEIAAAKPPTPPPLREQVANAGAAVANLTRRTADETVAQGKLLLPVVMANPPLDGPDPLPTMETPMLSLREAGQGVSSSLEPVADSARRALGLFLRDVPSPETPKGL